MTVHLTYGTTSHTVSELARLITERTGVPFVGHDSYFRGEYELADTPAGRIEIQPNAIPGDDGDNDLYDPDHSDVRILLLIRTSDPTSITAQLDSIDGLQRLRDKLLDPHSDKSEHCGS